MRDLTICLAYYENAGMLARQIEALADLPAEMRAHLELVVVDDGSPAAPATFPGKLPCHARLYRMDVDIPWNQDACRNLAVAEASTDWVLMTDMDHVPSEQLLKRAMTGRLDAADAYTFARVTAPHLTAYKPHPNSWLMTREMYARTGGYDERYAGVYGTDGMFRGRVEAAALRIIPLKEPLIRYPREVIPDASTTTLVRKSPENDARKGEVKAMIKASGELRPVRGLTPWTRVA